MKEPAIAFGRSTAGVDYESLDGQPSHLVFMIAATEGANNTHLEALSRLSTLLMREEIRKQLLKRLLKMKSLKLSIHMIKTMKKKRKSKRNWLHRENLLKF